MKRLIVLIVVATVAGRGVAADEVRLADFAAFKDIKAARASPDGKSIAYTVATSDVSANRVTTELWLIPMADADGAGEPRKLPLESDAIETILWAPKGSRLAVV